MLISFLRSDHPVWPLLPSQACSHSSCRPRPPSASSQPTNFAIPLVFWSRVCRFLHSSITAQLVWPIETGGKVFRSHCPERVWGVSRGDTYSGSVEDWTEVDTILPGRSTLLLSLLPLLLWWLVIADSDIWDKPKVKCASAIVNVNTQANDWGVACSSSSIRNHTSCMSNIHAETQGSQEDRISLSLSHTHNLELELFEFWIVKFLAENLFLFVFPKMPYQ